MFQICASAVVEEDAVVSVRLENLAAIHENETLLMHQHAARPIHSSVPMVMLLVLVVMMQEAVKGKALTWLLLLELLSGWPFWTSW